MTLHQRRTHATPVEGCFACKVSAVQVSSAAVPTRTEARPGQRAFMERFAAEFSNGDREAYKRLRGNGLQPPRIAGSAELERHASTRFEVETGVICPEPRKLREALSACADSGVDPLKACTTPVAG